jgi:hypothetical protein
VGFHQHPGAGGNGFHMSSMKLSSARIKKVLAKPSTSRNAAATRAPVYCCFPALPGFHSVDRTSCNKL